MMRLRNFVFLVGLILPLVFPGAGRAQDRIAYANLELVFARMPAAEQVARQLEVYQKELAASLDTKQAYAQDKLKEAQQAQASGVASDERLAQYQRELTDLDQEIRASAAQADQKLLRKRQELMEPIVEKLHTTIREIAVADGYTFVLNSIDGSGTSIVLYGEEDRDLTSRILAELGVSSSESAPASQSGNE